VKNYLFYAKICNLFACFFHVGVCRGAGFTVHQGKLKTELKIKNKNDVIKCRRCKQCSPAGCSFPTSFGHGGARGALPLLLPKEPAVQSKV
jgi:hypothetical protein